MPNDTSTHATPSEQGSALAPARGSRPMRGVQQLDGLLDPVGKLEQMGFRKAADWYLEAGSLECLFHEHEVAQNILYAFVRDRTILYIGKTVRPLKQRMYGYRRPH